MNSSVGVGKKRGNMRQKQESSIQSADSKSKSLDTDLDMSGEEEGRASTLARLASSLWIADTSEVGLEVEPA